jgi:hypothetical protein
MTWKLIPTLLAAILALGSFPLAYAQDPPTETEAEALVDTPPVAVVNVAGVDRVLDDVDYLFGSVERSDMTQVVNGLLGNIGDLNGLERSKPFGVMVFLQPGVIPTPTPIGYVPVKDAAALAVIVQKVPNLRAKKVSEDRYELVSPRRTIFVRLIGEYAFVAAEAELLDREFPDPAIEFAGLTTRYDVGLKVQPESVPPGMRDLFLTLLRTRAQADLQRRDNEPEAVYAFRKSQGMQNLRMVEAFLKETRSMTLGLDASRESRKAVLEMVIEAVPDTPYLETLQGLAEEPSRFNSLLDDDVPLAFSLNSKLDDYSKTAQSELLNLGEQQAAVLLTKLERGDPLTPVAPAADGATEAPADAQPAAEIEPTPAALDIAARIFAPIKAANEAGNLDAFAQFRGDPEQKFVALAGVELPGAAGMDAAVREFIDRFRAAVPEAAAGVEVQYGAAEAAGVSLHRIAPREIDEGGKRIFGDSPALYIGFGQDALWLTFGGPKAVETLGEAITRVNEASPVERKQPAAPFQLVVTANRWIGIGPSAENSALARDAFEGGDDTLRIDFRPTENGGRFRIEAEEGFIRLLGLGVSKRYDESQI